MTRWFADGSLASVWQPDQYRGQRSLDVVATQLAARGLTPSAQRRALQDWIDFFANERTPIRRLSLSSRVPQRLLDSLAGQPQLEALDIKWGTYSDLSAVAGLPNLRRLTLGGARAVTDLTPLASLSKLRTLVVDGAFLVTDLTPLSSLGALRELICGNCSLGSDKTVEVRDLAWIRPMTNLRTLQMPGSRLSGADLSDLLTLPKLSQLNLPLRRAYKKQVFEFASRSRAFAGLARAYDQYDEMRAG